jgi:hypothetical protein
MSYDKIIGCNSPGGRGRPWFRVHWGNPCNIPARRACESTDNRTTYRLSISKTCYRSCPWNSSRQLDSLEWIVEPVPKFIRARVTFLVIWKGMIILRVLKLGWVKSRGPLTASRQVHMRAAVSVVPDSDLAWRPDARIYGSHGFPHSLQTNAGILPRFTLLSFPLIIHN